MTKTTTESLAEKPRSEPAKTKKKRSPPAREERRSSSGEVAFLDSRTGKYYVIVGSFLDDDFAKDYAKNLSRKGYQVSIIMPFGGVKFHRVAVADASSLKSVVSEIERWKAEFGGDIWALRY